MAAAARKKLTLTSSDGEVFEVEAAVALQSESIKHMIEDDCADSTIPLPNVPAKILSLVLEYCKKHAEASPEPDLDLGGWDAGFINVDQETLYDLILAANYLEVKGLLNLTCKRVADMIKGKDPEEIRQMFNIKNDFSPEEEEEMRKEGEWAFE